MDIFPTQGALCTVSVFLLDILLIWGRVRTHPSTLPTGVGGLSVGRYRRRVLVGCSREVMKQAVADTADGHQQGPAMSAAAVQPPRRRCSVPIFTAIVSCVVLFWMIGYAYTTGVLRTLERRFGLSSSQSGVVQSSNDIMHVSVVVFIGYFGLRGNKPRIICVTTALAALGNLLMALPHFVFRADAHQSHQLTTRA